MNNKRKTLKKVAGIGGVAAAVPSLWGKPIINSVVLPAHAETSGLVEMYSQTIPIVSGGTDVNISTPQYSSNALQELRKIRIAITGNFNFQQTVRNRTSENEEIISTVSSQVTVEYDGGRFFHSKPYFSEQKVIVDAFSERTIKPNLQSQHQEFLNDDLDEFIGFFLVPTRLSVGLSRGIITNNVQLLDNRVIGGDVEYLVEYFS